MDPTKMSIVYACYFCKESFAFCKSDLESHFFDEGCEKMDKNCTQVMIIETSEDLKSCRVYLNHLNVQMHLDETLKKLEWPATTQCFFSQNEWYTAHTFDELKYQYE
jgi:uncharacterized protein YukJ